MIEPTDCLRLVLDPVRLAVLGAAALGPVDAREQADRLGVKPKTVLIILERIAQEFEPGVRCAERDVDFTLQLWYPDTRLFAAIWSMKVSSRVPMASTGGPVADSSTSR